MKQDHKNVDITKLFNKVKKLFKSSVTLPTVRNLDITRINIDDFIDIRLRVNSPYSTEYYIVDIDPLSNRIVGFLKCYDLMNYDLSIALRNN